MLQSASFLNTFHPEVTEVPQDPQHTICAALRSISGTQEQQSRCGGSVTYFSRVCGFMVERRLRAQSARCGERLDSCCCVVVVVDNEQLLCGNVVISLSH